MQVEAKPVVDHAHPDVYACVCYVFSATDRGEADEAGVTYRMLTLPALAT